MSKLKLTASDIDACMSGPEVGPVDAGMIAEQALAAIELEAALAAAEAKLADERRHADWLAKQYRECSVWPSTEEQHAGCECGWTWGYMEHGDFEQEEQHAPECPNAVHAARRAAEKSS